MLLALDIGNTLMDFGLFDEKELKGVYKAATKPLRSSDEYKGVLQRALLALEVEKERIDRIILSCVVPPLSPIFMGVLQSFFGIRPLFVGPGLSSGIRLKVDNPLEVGSDLVADVAGGIALYGKDLFIADLGTASKYLYIDEEGAFRGLAIAPGFESSIRALRQDAAALPEVNLIAPKSPIGTNTLDCINSGITYGTSYEVRGFAKAFEEKLGKPLKKILTGGNAPYVRDLLPEFEYAPSLLLEGLASIAERRK